MPVPALLLPTAHASFGAGVTTSQRSSVTLTVPVALALGSMLETWTPPPPAERDLASASVIRFDVTEMFPATFMLLPESAKVSACIVAIGGS